MYKKTFLLLLLIILVSLYSCANDNPDISQYISGSYMNNQLNVGYNFFDNGGGYQFISDSAFLIEYKIKNGFITITTLLEDEKITKTFPFKKYPGSIKIDNITYTAVKDDISAEVISE